MPANTLQALEAQYETLLKRPAVDLAKSKIRVDRSGMVGAVRLVTYSGRVFFTDGRSLHVRATVALTGKDHGADRIRPEPSADPCARRFEFRRVEGVRPESGQSRNLVRIEDEDVGRHGLMHFHNEGDGCCSAGFHWVEVTQRAGGPEVSSFTFVDALDMILTAYYEGGDPFCKQFFRLGFGTAAGRPIRWRD